MTRLLPHHLIGLFALALLSIPMASGAAAQPAAVWKNAWPMVGHDPQQTGRSPGDGPLTPHLLWTYRGLSGPALIGPDGSVYGWSHKGLLALSATGRLRWIVPAEESFGGPPALGPDGLLRVSGQLPGAPARNLAREPRISLFAVASQGRRVWTIRSLPWATVPRSVPFSKGVAPIVTAANVLYVPFVGPAYQRWENTGVEIVSPRGTPLRRLLAGFGGAIAVAPGGTVYQLGYDYQGHNEILATRTDGALLWHRGVSYGQSGSVVVGLHGTVYVSDAGGWGPGDVGEVAAFTPAGRRLWQLATRGGPAALAERADGTILAADGNGLTALSPRGRRLWHVSLGRPPANAASPSLAVDAAGRAYVGSSDGRVRAVASGGTLRWTLDAGGPSRAGFTPSLALGPTSTLAVTGTDNVLRLYH
ncbi:MAG TPA: PQQ-binding-like beta-propeller repeat protein [Chloroflexota bacterium]|nr:PQQ-binding-like beta-propeller repeat protein [Chloroflexota bacterium]